MSPARDRGRAHRGRGRADQATAQATRRLAAERSQQIDAARAALIKAWTPTDPDDPKDAA